MPGAVTVWVKVRTWAGATWMPTLSTAPAEGNSSRTRPDADRPLEPAPELGEAARTLTAGSAAACFAVGWSPRREGDNRQSLYRPQNATAPSAVRVRRVGTRA